jgi:hypothetical protein
MFYSPSTSFLYLVEGKHKFNVLSRDYNIASLCFFLNFLWLNVNYYLSLIVMKWSECCLQRKTNRIKPVFKFKGKSWQHIFFLDRNKYAGYSKIMSYIQSIKVERVPINGLTITKYKSTVACKEEHLILMFLK